MLVQVGSFCTPNWAQSCLLAYLQQDFVICKVGSKHLMMNILAALHFAFYFLFTVITSEINLTDHKSITARHFPDQ